MEDWIIIGEIINTKGIKGELKIRPETDYPDRFLDMKELLIQTGKTVKPYPIERVYLHKNMVFCKVTGIETPEEADRFRGRDFVPRSYFAGATPQNNYEPTAPYTLTFFENPYSRDQLGEGYLTLHIRSSGADSPRQIKLRTKPSTGQWFLWEQFLMVDIRQPTAADPWA